MSALTLEQRLYFRDQLREARASALHDSEGFHPIVTALERLGSILHSKGGGLGAYQGALLHVGREGASGQAAEGERPGESRLEALFSIVRTGRNDAVHQGAYARHLVDHCVELALHIEAGLMADSRQVMHFMVQSPLCAQPWQLVGFARQQMLANSFSYLPIRVDDNWKLLSDFAIAVCMASSEKPVESLRESIASAGSRGALLFEPAMTVGRDSTVQEALKICSGRPVLIVDEDRLLGIATPFDFL